MTLPTTVTDSSCLWQLRPKNLAIRHAISLTRRLNRMHLACRRFHFLISFVSLRSALCFSASSLRLLACNDRMDLRSTDKFTLRDRDEAINSTLCLLTLISGDAVAAGLRTCPSSSQADKSSVLYLAEEPLYPTSAGFAAQDVSLPQSVIK